MLDGAGGQCAVHVLTMRSGRRCRRRDPVQVRNNGQTASVQHALIEAGWSMTLRAQAEGPVER